MKILYLAMLVTASAYGQWITGYYQGENGVESVYNIPFSKYTHIIHFAANPGPDGTLVYGPPADESIALTSAAHAAGVKALLCITSNTSYFEYDTRPETIDAFISNIVAYINQYGYDGVDLDWEAHINVPQYASLITQLRSALGSSKIMSISAYGGGGGSPKDAILQAGPELPDQINVMTYDMDVWAGYSWFITALNSGPDNQLSIQSSLEEFTRSGIPAWKLGVGIPLYARHYTGASTIKQTEASRVGSLAYRDLVAAGLLTPDNEQYDVTYGGAYLSFPYSNEFFPYTSPRLIQDIVAWAKFQGIGGFSTYTLDYEYLADQAGDARYPLSSALNAAIFGVPADQPAAEPADVDQLFKLIP